MEASKQDPTFAGTDPARTTTLADDQEGMARVRALAEAISGLRPLAEAISGLHDPADIRARPAAKARGGAAGRGPVGPPPRAGLGASRTRHTLAGDHDAGPGYGHVDEGHVAAATVPGDKLGEAFDLLLRVLVDLDAAVLRLREIHDALAGRLSPVMDAVPSRDAAGTPPAGEGGGPRNVVGWLSDYAGRLCQAVQSIHAEHARVADILDNLHI